MNDKTIPHHSIDGSNRLQEVFGFEKSEPRKITSLKGKLNAKHEPVRSLPEILVITSYPPRECGIATYSQDLIRALKHQFDESFTIRVCALEVEESNFEYPKEVRYRLNTSESGDYKKAAQWINQDRKIQLVLIQHEFGLFYEQEASFLQFTHELTKPVVSVFHTVLPRPDEAFKEKVQHLVAACQAVVVMTHNSAKILMEDYDIAEEKIVFIAHGTHLVQHLDEAMLKEKYKLSGRKVITTFGLLSRGKGIETTLEAMPAIIESNPEIMFQVIGATHPEVVKKEGEVYRRMLEMKVQQLGIQDHVKFINRYLDLDELLENLQLSDVYVFSSNDPNQAIGRAHV